VKVVKITGTRECEIVDRPLPSVRDNYCLIRVLASPMCTEFYGYRDGVVNETIGHEAAGEVVEVSRQGRIKVGDRVVVMPQDPCGTCALCLAGDYIHCTAPRDPKAVNNCETGRATYAEYVIQQDWMLLPVPGEISIDHASMACCGLGPSFNAIHTMNVSAIDTVLVSGLGPVGMGAVINARVRGARVIGLDTNPWRADLARALGAESVVDPTDPEAYTRILELTDGRGVDKSVEASSAQTAPAFLVKATRSRGEVTTVGWGGPVNAADLTAKGITYRGAWHWNHLRYAREMMETIRLAGPLLDLFITHRFPLSDVQKAWELQLTGKCGKVILQPGSN